jgi:F-type H+-transporting ATPase subunit delta
MRGSSAKSLTAVLSAVGGVTGVKAASVLGAELFAVTATLDREVALRRVLTDPSTETAGKQALVSTVFGASLDAGTLEVLKIAVAGRWASGRDLVAGLEIAGVNAWAQSSAASKKGEKLESELFAASQLVHDNAELRAVVADRTVPTDAKATLLASIFKSKVSAPTLAVLTQAAAIRGGSFEKVIDRFIRQIADRQGEIVAVARVAYALSEAEATRLETGLAAKYGRPVQLNLVVDPSIVGGISVSVGDEVVDATMSTRLESARRLIAG